MALESVNPATGEVLETHPELASADVAAALDESAAAFASWRRCAVGPRGDALRRAATLLREERRIHGEIMALEMGKPVSQGVAEAEKCAWVCEHYADHAEAFLAPELVPSDATRSVVRYEPLGVILAVMPWNFPYWQVFRAAAPTLMAGNAMLLKHAANVPRCARAIEDLLRRAGLPRGLFRNLPLASARVGEVIAHPAVRGVTLTGSERAGAEVAAQAGRALKKTVLELGGSDPFLVLEDAPIEDVAEQAARARTINSGQSCIAAKRFVVVETAWKEFLEAFRVRLEALRIGDPLDDETEVGPLAREDLLETLDRQVRESVAAGARLLTGGRRLERPGFFYAPTLLAGGSRDAPAACEETFGPVAAAFRVRDADEAVELANASRYGLGASVWTGDASRGEAIAARLECGHVAVNGIVKSDPRLPFGGVKASGYGRELGLHGIREFVNVKTLWLGPARRAAESPRAVE